MTDPVERDFAKYEKEQVQSEIDAERRDEIFGDLKVEVIDKVKWMLSMKSMSGLAILAENYNADLHQAISVLYSQADERDINDSLFSVLILRTPDLEQVSELAELIVEFFDFSDEIELIIKEQDKAGL